MSRVTLLRAALGAILALMPMAALASDTVGFEEIGRWTDGPAAELALDGAIAWIGRGSRLEAVDLSDPAHPLRLASLELPGPARDLAARDGWVYAMIDGALVVVDGRQPERPLMAARLELFESTWWGRLELSGNVVYCIDQELVVVDVTTPSQPQVVRRLDGLHGRDVAAGGGRVFVAGGYGLCVMDATDPRAPVLLEVMSGNLGYYEGNLVEVHDNLVVLGVRSHGFIFSGLIGDQPTWVWGLSGAEPTALAFHGDNIYVADETLARYEPYEPWESWLETDLVGRCPDIEIDGDLMVVTTYPDGLVTYDLGAGPDPVRLASLAAGPAVVDLHVVGDRAYAACGWSGLQVFDTSHPRTPRTLGSYHDGPVVPPYNRFKAEFVSTLGDVVLLGGVNGLRLIDATDDLAPVLIRDIPLGPDASWSRPLAAWTIEGGWMVAYGNNESSSSSTTYKAVRPQASGDVSVVDVAWPPDIPRGCLTSDGRYLYTAAYTQGLVVAEVTADNVVVRRGTAGGEPYYCQALTVAEGFAYLAGLREVLVVDVRDPAQPRRRGRTGLMPWYSNDGIAELAACDRMVFANYGLGLGLVDATDPDSPVGRDPRELNAYPTRITAGVDEIYMIAGGAGLVVLRALRAGVTPQDAADGAIALTAAPNPCNPRTTIAFTSPQPGPATVAVHDARGRLVRRLHDGALGAGEQSWTWAGDDDEGRAVAAGVYLVRVATPAGTQVTRVTVVR